MIKSILNAVTFGLVKLNLWVPVLFSVVYLIIGIANGFAFASWVYILGLVISFFISGGLTYYILSRKVVKASKKEDKIEKKPVEKRKRIVPETPELPYFNPDNLSQAGENFHYQPQAEMQPQQPYEMPANPPKRVSLYEDNQDYGYERRPRSDASEQLYSGGENFDTETGRPLRGSSANELYNDNSYEPKERDRANSLNQLYGGEQMPERVRDRENSHRQLYATDGQSDGVQYAEYPNANPNLGNNASSSFVPYGQSVNKQNNESAGFSSYNKPQSTQSENTPQTKSFSYDDNGQLEVVEKNSKIELLQIYATRQDENLYVYEYTDRFDWVQLLPDGGKEIVKTQKK